MLLVLCLGAAGTAYCAAYLVYCIKRKKAKDVFGAAVLCLLASGALLLCVL